MSIWLLLVLLAQKSTLRGLRQFISRLSEQICLSGNQPNEFATFSLQRCKDAVRLILFISVYCMHKEICQQIDIGVAPDKRTTTLVELPEGRDVTTITRGKRTGWLAKNSSYYTLVI